MDVFVHVYVRQVSRIWLNVPVVIVQCLFGEHTSKYVEMHVYITYFVSAHAYRFSIYMLTLHIADEDTRENIYIGTRSSAIPRLTQTQTHTLQIQAIERLDCRTKSAQSHVAEWTVQSAILPHCSDANGRSQERMAIRQDDCADRCHKEDS